MARVCSDQKWVRLDSADGETENEDEDEDGEYEALSLCDLPINEEKQSRKKEDEAAKPIETQEQFDFSSWGGCVLPESDMCAADEVFFQGQLLPLRHSISSDSGLGLAGVQNPSRSISRSESMDHSYSGGFTSSRSSSIRSYWSSSSGSSATDTAATALNYKPRTRNQFHSHPSPSPQIRLRSVRHGSSGQSTVWSFLRVGLMRTPEIELQDLKARSNNTTIVKSSGSRNSYSYSNNNASNTQNNKTINKIKLRLLDKMGSCKCSVINSVVETVPSRTVVIRENRAFVKEEEEEEEEETRRKKTKQQHGKQTLSRHRTFEWLKELSLGDEFA